MKQVIRLTESDLHRMIKESVRQVLKETSIDNDSYFGGGLPDKYNISMIMIMCPIMIECLKKKSIN